MRVREREREKSLIAMAVMSVTAVNAIYVLRDNAVLRRYTHLSCMPSNLNNLNYGQISTHLKYDVKNISIAMNITCKEPCVYITLYIMHVHTLYVTRSYNLTLTRCNYAGSNIKEWYGF